MPTLVSWCSYAASNDVNLTKRGKWLTAIAALVAGYVVFGPKDTASVEPARTSSSAAARTAHAAAASVETAPVAPSAPPLPFQFIGSYTPDGQAPVFFLTRADRVYDVHIGDTLDDTYSIDSFANGQLVLTYKPLNIQQQLLAGVSK